MSAQKPTFKSYVDIGADVADSLGDVVDGDVDETAPPNLLKYVDPTLKLIPGEVILAETPCVLKYSLFSEKKKGLNGSLFCTNFRVAYVACVEEDAEPDWKRNRLMGENDIPLSCIDSLYGEIKGKRKKLSAKSKQPKRPKMLEIHCKDFRVHFFALKFADKAKAKELVNEILKVAYPDTEKDLFAFKYKGHKGVDVEEMNFQTAGDWDRELKRVGASNSWKIVQLNQNYTLSLVLPEVLVVPMLCRTPELKQAAVQFQDGRLPTWSYTLPNQASLVRMAYLIPETEYSGVEEQMIEHIKNANSGGLQSIDLQKQLPCFPELRYALEKLREICLPLSSKDLRQTDDSWLSSLEGTHWMVYIRQCLEVASNIASKMIDGVSVIMREPGAADFSCLISSLVHLILDPFYRTRAGFEALVRKEWVCAGHRFLTRLGLIFNPNNENEEAPIFQLFLDCVWQLAYQFPSSFEFSETYLTALSDTTHLGLCSEFSFDSLYQSKKWARECGKYNKSKFLSVWNWSAQFSDKFQTLFVNPVFEPYDSTCENGDMNGCFEKAILMPNLSLPMLGFWSQCYLRWLSPIAILNGGAPSQYLTQCKLAHDIQTLKEELEELEVEPELRKTQRPEFFLSLHSDRSASLPGSAVEIMTSSFPFTPLSPKEEFMAITARTIDRLDETDAHNLTVGYSESDSTILDD